ncbi:MAG TPA: hypothetical protein VJM32_06250 [Candidatus Saccharimonadales bacterium]|nr:hypothetical protein [Candidatus Saccharimonadales bacterium]
MKLTGPMQVELVGRGKLKLTPSMHVATGGEGSVYRAAGTMVKLYTDPKRLSQPGMMENLKRLTAFQHESIVSPRNMVLDSSGTPIGFYMDYVEGGESLSSIFTNDYRQRTGFGDEQASLLVEDMFGTMGYAHDRNTIMCDPNELNWTTVPGTSPARKARAFDVDAWITAGFKPQTVPMMASIRDWHTPKVGIETDRFALGVVTFQVYTGIHPYRGTLDGYKRTEMERRMKEKKSVFTAGVRLNQAVRDFSCIPGPLLAWYEAAFQNGERSQPPSPFYTGTTTPARQVRVMRIVTTSAGSLKYERLFDRSGDPVIRVFPSGVVLLRSLKLFDTRLRRQIGTAESENCELVKVDGGWLVANGGRRPTFAYLDATTGASTPLTVNLNAQSIVRYQNRLFGVTIEGLVELHLKKFARPILSVGQTWQTMFNSTHWFDGVGVLDAMGAKYLIAPFGTDACGQVRVRELDDLRVVAAKGGTRFVSVVAINKDGEYRKVEFTFDRLYKTYTVWEGDAEGPELNMSLLPRGVVATIVRDGELVIFAPTGGNVNRVADKDATTTMLLGDLDDTVVFIRDGQLWRVSMS